MSAATAPITDVSRTGPQDAGDSRQNQKITSQSRTQCKPVPLPALGTQKIVQGNGTSVGTVISLQCPDKHELVGNQFVCIMGTNSSHWVGEPYCRPLSPFEIHGFRVAIWASVVSSVIILLMSIAFITCCMVDCMNKNKKRRMEREQDMWQFAEDIQHHGSSRHHHGHKSRNNNNNNSQDEFLSARGSRCLAVCDSVHTRGCYQQQAYGPSCSCGHTHPLSALSDHDYTRPLLHHNPVSTEVSGPPHHYIRTSPGLDHDSAVGPWSAGQYGAPHRTLTSLLPSNREELNTRNANSAKEFSIRVISV